MLLIVIIKVLVIFTLIFASHLFCICEYKYKTHFLNSKHLFSIKQTYFVEYIINMENQDVNEGELLKNYMKGSGKPMTFYFEALDMTRQNLGHHLRKDKLEEDFALKVKDRLKLIIKDGAVFSIAKTAPDDDNTLLPPELQVTEGKKKDVKLLGKHVPLRLKPEEYAEAFGDWPGLPMYNAPVTASFVETYRDESVYKPQYYLHDPRFRDCDFGAIITGDSMHSEIRHGDFIACKEVKDTRFIVYGDIYYVVATNGLETCKYVNVDPEDRNNLLLVARSEKISPSPLPKEMIHKLYKVRGIVRGY